ncbi:MAG: type III pantothenate kinase [Clostridia bacterium]|nr:type III pantothenate kinase [Clostridia bacterium]
MLLAVEIDNTQITFGLFEDISENVLSKSFKIATDVNRTSDEYAVIVDGIFGYYGIDRALIDGAVISSVVPTLTDVIKCSIIRLTGGVESLIVGKGIKTGFPIKIDNPSELGTDLVANAAAVIDIGNKEKKFKIPRIIIDMGTATTIFAVNANGEYIGGSILPGVGISLDVLHGKTAQLPNVAPAAPTHVIGKNSSEAVRSGVILGNAMMIDGFVRRFADEMKCGNKAEVFITGEYAEAVIPYCEHTMRHVPELTLMGLLCIYRNNTKV